MKTKTFALALLSVASFAGCASPTEESDATDTSESAWESGTWQKVKSCNGGAAALDVDTGERRTMQFVIRDPNAINYLTGKLGMQLGPLNRGNGRELIVRGWSQNGIFAPNDFKGLAGPMSGGDVLVYRENNGIKIVFRHDDGIQGGFCTDNLGGWEGGCLGGWAGGTRVMRELANWYFDSCN